MERCHWVDLKDGDYVRYHDTEWGRPVHEENALFEALILECFQAGLSFQCILKKRAAFRKAFDNFDVQKVVKYPPQKELALLQNKGIVRHKLKIKAVLQNAKVFCEIQKEFGSFDKYIWGFTEGKTLLCDGFQGKNDLSDFISKDLKKRGMKFVGSVTVFSFLCAIGIFSAHQPTCFLYKK
ncbi:MAG: DNA-3-methyladenine glycosylase I [Alphaproteobacteria bacterium]|nr:DNA-3-methyladenine glycosylase I [Alphaproteobacteria bacterium]